jgi:hypothetical protein
MATVNSRWAAIWQAACERAAFNVSALLRLARRRATHSAVLEVLRAAPRSPDEKQDADAAPFARCALAAVEFRAAWEADLLTAVIAYFEELAAMRPRRRAMLEASIAGALIGQGMGG